MEAARSSKTSELCVNRHGVTTKNIYSFINTAVRTSNLLSNTPTALKYKMARSGNNFTATHKLDSRLHFYSSKKAISELQCLSFAYPNYMFRSEFELNCRYILAVSMMLKVIQLCPYRHVNPLKLKLWFLKPSM